MSTTLGPNQTNISPGVPFFAPAGSGNSGSPNPSFSTISLAPGNFLTFGGAINYTSTLVFQDSGTPVNQTFVLAGNTTGSNGYANIFSTATTFCMNSPQGSSATLVLGAGNDNNNYILSGNSGGTPGNPLTPLNVFASAVNISSLTVSSINGAIPALASDMSTLQGQVAELRSTLGFV
jgi:hypothetical protein